MHGRACARSGTTSGSPTRWTPSRSSSTSPPTATALTLTPATSSCCDPPTGQPGSTTCPAGGPPSPAECLPGTSPATTRTSSTRREFPALRRRSPPASRPPLAPSDDPASPCPRSAAAEVVFSSKSGAQRSRSGETCFSTHGARRSRTPRSALPQPSPARPPGRPLVLPHRRSPRRSPRQSPLCHCPLASRAASPPRLSLRSRSPALPRRPPADARHPVALHRPRTRSARVHPQRLRPAGAGQHVRRPG